MRQIVLVVAGDPDVRRSAVAILRDAGCGALEAANALDALVIAANHDGPVDVLMAIGALAGIPAPQLAEKIARVFPGIEIVHLAEGDNVAAALPAMRKGPGAWARYYRERSA